MKIKHTVVLGLFQRCSPAGSLDQLLDVEWFGSDVVGVRGRTQSEVLIKLKRTKWVGRDLSPSCGHVVLVLCRLVEIGRDLTVGIFWTLSERCNCTSAMSLKSRLNAKRTYYCDQQRKECFCQRI